MTAPPTSGPPAATDPDGGLGRTPSQTAPGVQLTLTFATGEPGVQLPALRTLTDEQEQAIARRRGSLLLAAGAGSGKTAVLVERFVRAVIEDGLAPGRILAITFTERAAGELKERIRARFMELGAREAARDTEAAFIGTFHGFCARLLRTHPLLAGLDPEFTVLDEPHSERLRLQAFAGALGAFIASEGPPAVDLVAAYGADRVRAMVLGVYAQLRSQGHALPSLPPVSATDWPAEVDGEGARACALLDSLLRGFSERYAALKRERSGLDFDDLELFARALLEEHGDVRASWSERLELVMVDEFQDTNSRQLAVLAALERDNLFTVGDELQSIYGFRHAEVGLFRARRTQLAERGASLALTWNFRSRPPLLAAINAVFATRFGAAYTPLAAGREGVLGKQPEGEPSEVPGAGGVGGEEAEALRNGCEVGGGDMNGVESDEVPIELLLTDRRSWNGDSSSPAAAGELPAAPRWRQAEARLLAQRIADLVHAGRARPGDVAVLLRAAGDLPLYQRALEEHGLRTLAAVGSFWGHPQVGDLLAYLRALANPLDELALYSTLASPLVGLSSDALALLARAAQGAGIGVWDTIRRFEQPLRERLDPIDRERLELFASRFAAERAGACARPLCELLRRALADTGYERHVLSLPWGERRLANLHKLQRLAVRFEVQEGRDLRGFLDHIAHQQDLMEGSEPEAPAGDLEPEAVRLLSIHAAKGLEFPVVCLADLGRVPPSTAPALLVDGARVGLRLAKLDGSEAAPSLHYTPLLEARRQAEAEEEARILYVAMTRARELLLLSGAVDFERWPGLRPGPRLQPAPITWLAPALIADLPARAAALENPVQVLGVSGAEGVSVRCLFHTPATSSMAPGEGSPCAAVAASASDASLSGGSPPAAVAVTASDASLRGGSPPAAVAVTAPDAPLRTPTPTAIPPRPPLHSTPNSSHARPHPSSKMISPPAVLSYTALSELERCGYRYYLERVLGLPEERSAHAGRTEGGLPARARGVLVHRLLQSLDFARPEASPSPDEVELLGRALGIAVSARERDELAALLKAACATALARRLAGAAHVRREHPFAFHLAPYLDGPLVTGVLDILVREPSGDCLIVDYKSDRVAVRDALEALVQRDYGAQRLIYALAALHDGAPRVEVVHWFLARPEAWATATFTAADTPALQRELADRAERARSTGFAVTPTPHRELCATCPGRATLCSWGDAETLREPPLASVPQ